MKKKLIMFLSKPLQIITALITSLMLATSSSAANSLKILKHAWNVETYDVITELTETDNNVYTGRLSFSEYQTIILSYNGKIYQPEQYQPFLDKDSTPANPYTFNPVKDGSSPGSYIQFKYAGSFDVKATVNADASSIKLEFTTPPPPTPLTISVDGQDNVTFDDINNLSTTFTSEAITVKGTKKQIAIKAGEIAYGPTADIKFNTSDNSEQIHTSPLSKGGSVIDLEIDGTYSVSVTVSDGEPTSVTVTRSEVVPELTVNDTTPLYFSSENRTYSGIIDLKRHADLKFAYLGHLYHAESGIIGDGTEHKVNLTTSGAGTTDTKGAYRLTVDMNTNPPVLTYVNTTPPGESSLSPTIPDAMLDYDGTTFIPDEPMTMWYADDTNSLGWLHSGTDQGEQGFHDFHLGNGHLGVSMLGAIGENIMLNEKTHFDGSRPADYEANKSIGEYCRAGYLFNKIDVNNVQSYKFLEQLDLIAGVGTTRTDATFYSGENAAIFREYFVSRPDNVFVMNITAEEQTFSMNFKFTELKSITVDADNRYFSASTDLSTVSTCFACRLIPDAGATVTVYDTDGLAVNGAKSIMVVMSCVSNYDISSETYTDSALDIEAKAKAIVNTAAAKTWQQLYDAHTADHSALMSACSIDFGGINDTPTDELLAAYKAGTATDNQKRMLEALIFQYGRYKTVGSSRRGDQLPSNLRGIWMSGQRWNGDIHADLNVEMNYWPAENTNLSSCHEPFLDYIMTMSKKAEWKGYAQHRAPGADADAWTLDNANNIFGAAQLYISQYSEANAWYCHHLWQHWLYTLDRDYLARAVPVMMNACKFWEKRMTWDSALNKWICPDVWSPENQSGGNTAVHSRQLVWELFRNTIEGIRILGSGFSAGQAHLSTLEEIFADIDPGLHIMNGALCEWAGTTPIEDGHRHLSHLMCLYPMAQVSPFDADRSAFDAAIAALDLRGDGDGGEASVWNNAWKMNCRARNLDGNGPWGAYHQLGLATEFMLGNLNATTAQVHQIDGNAGLTAGIAEMLMQSYRSRVTSTDDYTEIHLLPALPDEWAAGSFKGLKAIGNIEVEAEWTGGAITHVALKNCGTEPRNVFVRMTLPAGKSIEQMFFDNEHPAHSPAKARKAIGTDERPDEELAYIYDDATSTYLVRMRPIAAGATSTVSEASGPITGIDDIMTDGDSAPAQAPAEYFDLQGRRIAATPTAPGIYILHQGSRTTKILIGR